MRNTKVFDINIYDEQIEVSGLSNINFNHYFAESLSLDQQKLLEAPFLVRLSKGYEKWQETCKENNVNPRIYILSALKDILKNKKPKMPWEFKES